MMLTQLQKRLEKLTEDINDFIHELEHNEDINIFNGDFDNKVDIRYVIDRLKSISQK